VFLLNVGPERRHLLTLFAATNPVDYFSLLDCAMHSGTSQAKDVTAAAQLVKLLDAGILACHSQPAALLQQPHAVLSLASAVTSLITACKLQCAQIAAEGQLYMVQKQPVCQQGCSWLCCHVCCQPCGCCTVWQMC
jgi:hypothetical protein